MNVTEGYQELLAACANETRQSRMEQSPNPQREIVASKSRESPDSALTLSRMAANINPNTDFTVDIRAGQR